MRGLRGQTGNVEAAKSFAGHVKLDKRGEDGVVLDVEVFRGCHRDQGFDSGERNKASSWLLVGRRLLVAEHVVNLIVREACQGSAKPEELSANKVELSNVSLSL